MGRQSRMKKHQRGWAVGKVDPSEVAYGHAVFDLLSMLYRAARSLGHDNEEATALARSLFLKSRLARKDYDRVLINGKTYLQTMLEGVVKGYEDGYDPGTHNKSFVGYLVDDIRRFYE